MGRAADLRLAHPGSDDGRESSCGRPSLGTLGRRSDAASLIHGTKVSHLLGSQEAAKLLNQCLGTRLLRLIMFRNGLSRAEATLDMKWPGRGGSGSVPAQSGIDHSCSQKLAGA